MLAQRLRRWANINPALDHHLVLTECCAPSAAGADSGTSTNPDKHEADARGL